MRRLAPTVECDRPRALPQRSRKLYRTLVDFRDQSIRSFLFKKKKKIFIYIYIKWGGWRARNTILGKTLDFSLFFLGSLAEQEQKDIPLISEQIKV